jgi:hypothetical protein
MAKLVLFLNQTYIYVEESWVDEKSIFCAKPSVLKLQPHSCCLPLLAVSGCQGEHNSEFRKSNSS